MACCNITLAHSKKLEHTRKKNLLYMTFSVQFYLHYTSIFYSLYSEHTIPGSQILLVLFLKEVFGTRFSFYCGYC
jgi:hypothetical protein